MRNRVGESILNNKIERREAFLRKALTLYLGMGGTAEGVQAAARDVATTPAPTPTIGGDEARPSWAIRA